jgi:ParB family chromosome partitioning protein
VTRERRLGRGLEALLGRPLEATTSGASGATGAASPAEPLRVAVFDIDANPFQPRSEFGGPELESLAESVRTHGLLQPLVVRRVGERYQLIAGERRLKAAINDGLAEVPVVVRACDDRQAAELAMIENLQREDLNALDKAAAFQQYLTRYGCTQEELANRLKLDRSTISNLIRLLELPAEVQQALRGGNISPGHARALLALGDEPEQIQFCRRIQAEGLSVRETERLVQAHVHRADTDPLAVVDDQGRRPTGRRHASAHLAALEQELRAALGTRVEVRQTGKGRGRIVVHFASPEEFERLRRHLSGQCTSVHKHAG